MMVTANVFFRRLRARFSSPSLSAWWQSDRAGGGGLFAAREGINPFTSQCCGSEWCLSDKALLNVLRLWGEILLSIHRVEIYRMNSLITLLQLAFLYTSQVIQL